MELERWINEYGVDPTKLTKEELVKEISHINDFGIMADCIDYLYEIDKELATKSLLQFMTTDENDKNYGDRFYQAMFLGSLFSGDEDRALTYILENYTKMEVYILAEALRHITYVDDEKFNAVREKLKQFVGQREENYFQELREFESTKNIVKEFLESFE